MGSCWPSQSRFRSIAIAPGDLPYEAVAAVNKDSYRGPIEPGVFRDMRVSGLHRKNYVVLLMLRMAINLANGVRPSKEPSSFHESGPTRSAKGPVQMYQMQNGGRLQTAARPAQPFF